MVLGACTIARGNRRNGAEGKAILMACLTQLRTLQRRGKRPHLVARSFARNQSSSLLSALPAAGHGACSCGCGGRRLPDAAVVVARGCLAVSGLVASDVCLAVPGVPRPLASIRGQSSSLSDSSAGRVCPCGAVARLTLAMLRCVTAAESSDCFLCLVWMDSAVRRTGLGAAAANVV